MNLFDINKYLPANNEIFNNLFNNKIIRIEQIISSGQSSPEDFWYDQVDNEWVLILEGEGIIEFADNSYKILTKGEYLFIPAHCKHRVKQTLNPTIWLAIFFTN